MDKTKIKLIFLINIINLNIFIIDYKNSTNIASKDMNIHPDNAVSCFSQIKKTETLLLSENLAEEYNQQNKRCFKNIIQKYQVDSIPKVCFIYAHDKLYCLLEDHHQLSITSCFSGQTEELFEQVVWSENQISLNFSGYFADEIKKYTDNYDFKLMSGIHDLLLNFMDVSNVPIHVDVDVLYDEQKTIDGNQYRIKLVEIIPKNGKKKSRRKIIRFPGGPFAEYYTESGVALKHFFLKAPIKYGIMSSPYNASRLHPIKRIVIPHLGTDYYAFGGDPIYAIQSGIIEKQEFKHSNGNYIKIKHAGDISSQYLHMSEFKQGLGIGSFVQKGEIIGKVGKTGAATDDHVCFRFWHKGKQINHQSFNLQISTPDIKDLLNFATFKDSMYQRLTFLKNGN